MDVLSLTDACLERCAQAVLRRGTAAYEIDGHGVIIRGEQAPLVEAGQSLSRPPHSRHPWPPYRLVVARFAQANT